MLIRSQDKEILVNIEASIVFYISSVIGKKYPIFASNGYAIGFYSTKAKAMKVLDMIQEAYADAELNEILLPDVCKAANKSQQEKENTSIAKDIRNAFMKKMVFQMPDDESVEV